MCGFFDSKSPEEVRQKLSNIDSTLVNQDPQALTAHDLVELLGSIINALSNESLSANDFENYEYLKAIQAKLMDNKKNNESVRRIILQLLSPPIRKGPITRAALEGKLASLENELLRLSSKPELDAKISKVQEELASIKHDFEVGEERKFEDMLKEFKASKKKIFVIMPFSSDFDDVWRGGIERACKAEHIACLRVDEVRRSTMITDDIKIYIEQADCVIADITGSNPNVMFELGWALAKEKELIVIRQQNDPKDLPFDVHGIRYIPYLNTWSGIERLPRELSRFIKATVEAVAEKNVSSQ